MINYLHQGGLIAWAILILGLALYWQLSDCFWQTMKVRGALPDRQLHLQQELNKVKQLHYWVTVTPLLGLLGTVHGLLQSFMSLHQATDISLSNSIALALNTTELGLTVAIPAWVMVILLQHQLQQLLNTTQAQGNCS